jgi:hypothetical protein
MKAASRSESKPCATATKKPAKKVAIARATWRTKQSLQPPIQAALTLLEYNNNMGELCIATLVSELRNQCSVASTGDLSGVETMLLAQAHTLDAIFHRLARQAATAGLLDHFDCQLRIALKAQSQSRATLETLAAIKNPAPVAFVRQANISGGPQQVNNSGAASAHPPSRAGNESPRNKLLEGEHAERMDTNSPSAAAGTDCHLEAVDSINWSAIRGRQKQGC